MKKFNPIYALLTALIISVSFSCNSDDDEFSNGEPVNLSSSTLVKEFALDDNDSILADLDSVFFAIDVKNRMIYNPDSLPKGTKINRLVANISYDPTSKGEIKITGAQTMRDTTYSYDTQSSDSIDFTGNVFITITAGDGITTKQYRIKVNVHNMKPDSLYWNQMARRNLPARTSNLIKQKTVKKGDLLYCLIEEKDGYTLSTIDNPSSNKWTIKSLKLNFTPKVSSFNATTDALYILSSANELYTSTDGFNWTNTGKKLYSIVGNYNDVVLGVSEENGKYYHDYYSAKGTTLAKQEVDPEFPISGHSQCLSMENEWSYTNQSVVLGGRCANKELTGSAWGFDGENWGEITRHAIPGYNYPTLFRYTQFTGKDYNKKAYPVWIAMGGIDEQGKLSKKVYVSFDNCITWKEGDELLQLPEYIRAFSQAQAFVFNSTMETRGMNNGWTAMPSRKLPGWWTIGTYGTRASQPIETWECPYIYLFGGMGENGLMNNIWKGVINRLSFKPII